MLKKLCKVNSPAIHIAILLMRQKCYHTEVKILLHASYKIRLHLLQTFCCGYICSQLHITFLPHTLVLHKLGPYSARNSVPNNGHEVYGESSICVEVNSTRGNCLPMGGTPRCYQRQVVQQTTTNQVAYSINISGK